MNYISGTEYEYARSLVFFGFICGIAFTATLVVITNIGR